MATSILLSTVARRLKPKGWNPSLIWIRSILVLYPQRNRNLSIVQQVEGEIDAKGQILIRERENLYIHSQFRIWPDYKSTVYDVSKWSSPESWSSSPPVTQQVKEMVDNAQKLDTKIPIMDSSLEPIRQKIVDEISSMNDDELFRLLYGLSFFHQDKTSQPEYKKFWQTLDAECCKRMPNWDTETSFVVDDLLYLLSFGRSSDFHYQFTKKICRKMEKGRPEYFVRSMFVLNISRALPKFLSPFELEFIFKKVIDGLNTSEIATVCIALFKTEAKLQDVKLMEKIVDRIIAESKTMHPILIGGVSKFLRFTGKTEVSDAIYKFQDAFLPEIPRVDLAAALHLALAGTTSTTFNSEMITVVKDKFEALLERTRLKEMERLMLALTMFNMDAESFYQKVASEVQQDRRKEEIIQYGRSLPPLLYYLSLRGIYIYDLIDQVLQKEFLVKYYGNNMAKYQREITCLDFSVGLNCPDYTGTRLSDKIRRTVTKFHTFYANPLNSNKISGYVGFLRQALNTSSAILGGDKYIHWCNILPQSYTGELLFCLDANNYPVEIPQAIQEIPDFEVKWIPSTLSNISFHAILVCNRGSTVHNSTELLGQKIEQVKQMTQIGYKVHTIVAREWQNLERDPEKQKELLMEKVFRHTLNPRLLKSAERARSQS